MIVALILLPALAGILALLVRGDPPRRALLVGVAWGHLALTLACGWAPPPPALEGWLAVDALSQLFLLPISGLFAVTSLYGVGYLAREGVAPRRDFQDRQLFSNAPEAIFTACLLLLLAFMSLVATSQHFGLLWVGIEATTLASAPLIYFHRHRRSLEATWKYLMVCSVGIALALLGYLFLAVAAPGQQTDDAMLVDSLMEAGASFHGTWLKASFILFLVGYGTKMGLAPMHTWKPDTYAEAPSLVSALMSGALSSCALLGILRAVQICQAAGFGPFARELLVGMGLLSVAIAAVFLVAQSDYKRMLAYSSIEHMGLLALGVGLSGLATRGALLHVLTHSLAKGLLFMVAGNLLATYHTREAAQITGALRRTPASAALWIAGFLAITGAPPFALFVSEFMILKGAVDQGRLGLAAGVLVLLAIIFVGMASTVLRMAQGSPPEGSPPPEREGVLLVGPPIALAALLVGLGVWVPGELMALIERAAALVGGAG